MSWAYSEIEMRYPTISRSTADEIARRLVAGENPPIGPSVSWTGAGEEIDLEHVATAFHHLEQAFAEFLADSPTSTPEEFEGIAAGQLHQALRELPIEVLDDPGFWRYLSLDKFWWFIAVREAGPLARGNHSAYIDGLRPSECVPLRMFLRAHAVGVDNDYTLASSLTRASDFWRSHVIRVRTGSAPSVARGFVRLQTEQRMPTDVLRPFAKRVNRLWSNVVLDRLDDDEADQVMRDLYEAHVASPQPADALDNEPT